MSEELKPCPFCGGKAVLLGGPQAQECHSVWCTECSAKMYGGMNAAPLVAKWNARPAPVQAPSGWKLVPAEPDHAMMQAGYDALLRGVGGIYAAMLAAAPSAPVALEVWSQEQVDAIKADADALLPEFKSKPAAPAVDAERVSGWIPVSERLPDMEAGYVLVHCEGGKIGDDFFCRNREFLHHAGNCYSRKYQGKESGYFRCAHEYGYRITHWQPLPPPPAIANQEAQDGR